MKVNQNLKMEMEEKSEDGEKSQPIQDNKKPVTKERLAILEKAREAKRKKKELAIQHEENTTEVLSGIYTHLTNLNNQMNVLVSIHSNKFSQLEKDLAKQIEQLEPLAKKQKVDKPVKDEIKEEQKKEDNNTEPSKFAKNFSYYLGQAFIVGGSTGLLYYFKNKNANGHPAHLKYSNLDIN